MQLSQFEQVAGDINYFVDFSTATTVLQDAIYLISSGSVDLSTYFLNSKYQAAAGPLPKFLKDITNAYHSAITVKFRSRLLLSQHCIRLQEFSGLS